VTAGGERGGRTKGGELSGGTGWKKRREGDGACNGSNDCPHGAIGQST
jgi:hypothetical protein